MICALAHDLPQVEAFLARHPHLAMFPLSNLRQQGIVGDHPYALTLWLARQDGAVTDVLALTRTGLAMPVLPSGGFAAAARALRGQGVIGLIGAKPWVRPLQAALGLTTPATLDRDEPHFLLPLGALIPQDGPGTLVPLAEAPAAVIKTWIASYITEALNTPAAQANAEVAARYDRYSAAQSHVCLMDGDQPLAMTGFNARLPDIVQIGGVYTPPALRGRGHARRAIALHLALARTQGVAQATLFAASQAAAQAYRAIGFRQVGDWTLLLLRDKEMVHG